MNLNHFSLTKISYLFQNPTPGIFNLEGRQPWSPYRRAATVILTETQMFERSDSKPYSVSSYCLYPQFSAKGSCCSYVRNDVVCSRVSNLESYEFSTLWLRQSCYSTTKFICSVYLSPYSTDYPKFFDYL